MKISHINEAITDPAKARTYIIEFMDSLHKDHATGFVDTPSQRIYFKDMSDDQAVFIANEFLGWTAEGAKQRLKKEKSK